MSTVETWSPLRPMLQDASERIAAISGQMNAAELEHARFRSEPVAGKLGWLKRVVYKFVNSSFTKQQEHNERMMGLLRELHASVGQQQMMIELLQAGPARPDTIERLQPVAGDNGTANRSLPGFSRVFNSVAQLRWPERVLIYSLVYGLKPRRMLEIGTAQGGSALITVGAMDDNGHGALYCVDLKFQVSAKDWSLLRHRATFIEGPSPDSLAQAGSAAGAGFDLAFIDGDHTYDGLVRDINGTLPYMADDSYLLFHDSHYADVKKAIDESVARHNELIDCGELSIEQTVIEVPDWGINLWGGLRLLRFHRAANARCAAGTGEE